MVGRSPTAAINFATGIQCAESELTTEAGMFGFGPWEIVAILLVVVLIFGVNKIPQPGKGLGEGIRNFKSTLKAINEDD